MSAAAALDSAAPPEAGTPPVAARVRRAERRDDLTLLLLAVPALLVIVSILIVPLLWLVGNSFVRDGGFTFANYQRILTDPFYATVIWETVKVTGLVMLITGVCGYVIAYSLTLMPPWASNVCLVLVALPFWTSALVRTYAWLALLQKRGVINKFLLGTGLIDEPVQMVNNLFGTYVGMVHVMLPLMVFPIYAALRRIDANYMRAAYSFGASPVYAFWRVYFPLSRPGLAAGSLIVFVLSLGFYITPALLGGGKVLMIAPVIARDINFNRDWGPASATAAIFVAAVLAIFAVGRRLAEKERIR